MQLSQQLGGRQAVPTRFVVVDLHLDLRRQHLLFDFQVDDARQRGEPLAQRLGLATQRVQVVAINLDGDLRPHATQQVVNAVADGLANANGGGQAGNAAADVGVDLGHTALTGLEAQVQLRHMHALGVFVQLGPAGAAADVLDLRNAAQRLFSHGANAGGFGQRGARVQPQPDQRHPFIEGRQKRGREQRHRRSRQQHRHPSRRQVAARRGQHMGQATGVARLDPRLHLGVPMVQTFDAGQQVVRHHRRDSDGHQHGRQQRHDVGHRQRLHQPAFHARQEEQRQQHQRDDDGGVHDGRTHLDRGLGDQLQWAEALVGVRSAVFFQPPEHVFHAHHRVIDQLTNGNRQAAQCHGVD